MATTIFLQNEIFTKFLFPFLLIFFIVFAILEKTKVLGDKKQIHALVSFVIGLIFITAVYPKLVVENLILFLTVALVAVFVVLLIWGFIFSGKEGFAPEKWMKWILWILAGVACFGAIIWATGWYKSLAEFFSSNLSQTVITNVVFVVVIAIALALILIEKKPSK